MEIPNLLAKYLPVAKCFGLGGVFVEERWSSSHEKPLWESALELVGQVPLFRNSNLFLLLEYNPL